MSPRRRIDRKVIWVLIGGFSLTILLLLVSGVIAIQAVNLVESSNHAAHERHRASTRLIDDFQSEEAGLNGILDEITARPGSIDRAALLRRLDKFVFDVATTLETGRSGPLIGRWDAVGAAADDFIAEVRGFLQTPDDPREVPTRLIRAKQALVGEVSALVAANYQSVLEDESSLSATARSRFRSSLAVLAVALVLAVLCAGATVYITSQIFHRSEWQARELSRLSTHVLEAQEHILQRFSRELHDEFGQILTAIEANLAAVPRTSAAVSARIEDCVLLVQDAMGNVRALSQLLRPSSLDDFGLVPSLELLAESFSQRNSIPVDSALQFDGRLPSDTETHLFRIAQEALTNVARHSGATRVELSLEGKGPWLQLSVADNGRGIAPDAEREGFGLIGMRERILSVGGRFAVRSDSGGVRVTAEVPLHGTDQTPAHSIAVGG